MKHLLSAACIACAAAAVPALASAQDARDGFFGGGTRVYGNIGYSRLGVAERDFNAVNARLGARFGRFVGVEGEGSLGFGDSGDDNTATGGFSNVKARNSIAAYAVGFLPVSPRADLLARVGVGRTSFSSTTSGTTAPAACTTTESSETFFCREDRNSFNVGAGGQFFFTDHDGVRLDYTWERFGGNNGLSGTGSGTPFTDDRRNGHVLSIAYSRQF